MNKDSEFLYNQLVKLGDMMGDGLHHEPGGKWIEKEYSKVIKALALTDDSFNDYLKLSKPKKDYTKRNELMKQRCEAIKCDCGGQLKQVRSGSLVAKCLVCSNKYRLMKVKK